MAHAAALRSREPVHRRVARVDGGGAPPAVAAVADVGGHGGRASDAADGREGAAPPFCAGGWPPPFPSAAPHRGRGGWPRDAPAAGHGHPHSAHRGTPVAAAATPAGRPPRAVAAPVPPPAATPAAGGGGGGRGTPRTSAVAVLDRAGGPAQHTRSRPRGPATASPRHGGRRGAGFVWAGASPGRAPVAAVHPLRDGGGGDGRRDTPLCVRGVFGALGRAGGGAPLLTALGSCQRRRAP